MNPLTELRRFGQSIWLDSAPREMILRGELRRLIEQDGVRGVSGDPFARAQALRQGHDDNASIRGSEPVDVEEVRMAADALRPVYEQTGGSDGFATVGIAPRLARDAAGSVAQARWLWRAVARPNVMVTTPAAGEGIGVIETLLAEGIHIHATLLFSLEHYETAARAFLRGASRARHPERLASVASIFVSRLDTAVDCALAAMGGPEARDLRGKIALANARMIYRRFREIFFGGEFAELRARGVRVQRLLWASTGTRNPGYSDVRYVEDLIGPGTAATLPPATLDAFREHGRVRGATVTEGLEDARRRLARLPVLGIDLRAVTEWLQQEGVARFQARANSAAHD